MIQLADLFSVPEMNLLCNVIEYLIRHGIDYHPQSLFWDVKVFLLCKKFDWTPSFLNGLKISCPGIRAKYSSCDALNCGKGSKNVSRISTSPP